MWSRASVLSRLGRTLRRPDLLQSKKPLVIGSHWSHSSSQPTEKWQLMSAVCLERFPVITQEMNPLEKKFSQLLQTMEHEKSHLSDHELRHLEDLKIAEKRKQENVDDSEIDVNLLTAVEAQDFWEDEREAFQPASRLTEADTKNDLRSIERRLDRKLLLVVKQKLGNSNPWMMPMVPRMEGESMRQAAERALATICGNELNAVFMGNAPCGFYKYRFPKLKPASDDFVGAKVFFFKAQLQEGLLVKSTNISDFCWLTKEELVDHLVPKYNAAVQDFLLDL